MAAKLQQKNKRHRARPDRTTHSATITASTKIRLVRRKRMQLDRLCVRFVIRQFGRQRNQSVQADLIDASG
jgi:hypothetical protein